MLAYLEGRGGRRVREHVARCPFCTAEVAALRVADRVLTDSLCRASCPATETLVRYQSRLLPARDRHYVESHLQVCALCTSELERMSALDAPQHTLWEEMRRSARAVIEAMRLEPPPRLALAVRSTASSPQLYRAGELDILLGSEAPGPARDLWRLKGRVTRGGRAVAALAGCTVRLVQQSRLVASQSVDDLGYFSFDRLAAGRYDFWLEKPEADVVVREVAAGEPE